MENYNLWTHYPESEKATESKLISKQIHYRSVPHIGEKVIIQGDVFAVTDVIHETDENRIVIKLKYTNW